MRTIRASELGTYLYCKRAWWYQTQGITSENQQEMAGGTAFHRQHGRTVLLSSFLRFLGAAGLLLALVLTAAGITYLLVR
jgi:hypothetical protein